MAKAFSQPGQGNRLYLVQAVEIKSAGVEGQDPDVSGKLQSEKPASQPEPGARKILPPNVRFSRNQMEAQDGVKFATMESYGNKPSPSDQASVKRLGEVVARALNIAEPDANGAYTAVPLLQGSSLRTLAQAFGKTVVGYGLAPVLNGKKSPFSNIGGVSIAAPFNSPVTRNIQNAQHHHQPVSKEFDAR